jgi:Holliday junction resolvase RusA-like endonuclease
MVVGPVFVCFEVPGVPQHKARHRYRIRYSSFNKPFVQEYPDGDTARYEKQIAAVAQDFMAGRFPTAKPLALLVHVFKPLLKSWTKRERADALAGRLLPVVKPDADNYLKIVDSLNGIIWVDDSQVIDARVIKQYAEVPGLRIEVREFLPRTAQKVARTL